MVIAVASGNCGTGKTTIATNLAFVAAAGSQPVQLVDCDVDEPNCHIFLHPTITETHTEELLRPQVDQATCTLCGACERACRFHAIVCMKQRVLLFEHLCHGCGACVMVCPRKAIGEVPQPLGVVEIGRAGAMHFVQGRLEVREARSQAERHGLELVLIDGPPGIGCPVIASISSADGALVVTEPSRSGLHDLKRICELTAHFRIPTWVCVNKFDLGEALARLIEREAESLGARTVGRISYSSSVTAAQLAGTTVVARGDGCVVKQTEALWSVVREALFEGVD